MNLNNNEVQEPTIAEFFAGKNVFVTGGTGFIGTVLLEALLSTTPKLGNIYLLIRDKYGSDTNERVRRLLSKQVISDRTSFSIGWKLDENHFFTN